MKEKRKEIRHAVPKIYQKYVTLRIKIESGEFFPVELLDFSLSGIKIRNPFEFVVDSTVECLISIPKSFTKETGFNAKIKYCIWNDSDESYWVGAEIIQTSEELWLNIFSRVHDFIKERIGDIF
jgi:hypothetical protein